MTYNITLDKRVRKFLDKQTDSFVKRFYEKVGILGEDPYTPFLDIKKLEGLDNAYRLRLGKTRFLYTVNNSSILIYFFDADNRGDVYKRKK